MIIISPVIFRKHHKLFIALKCFLDPLDAVTHPLLLFPFRKLQLVRLQIQWQRQNIHRKADPYNCAHDAEAVVKVIKKKTKHQLDHIFYRRYDNVIKCR